MNKKEACIIVLNMAEAKWITHNFKKMSPEQEKAIRVLSAHIEHGRWEPESGDEPITANTTHPLLWGNGWYAILDPDMEPDEEFPRWYVAPKDFFDKKGYCPDGWDWEVPEELKGEDKLDDFIDEFGCEPDIPEGFRYCMESCIEGEATNKISLEEQKQKLKDFGFIVDNIPE